MDERTVLIPNDVKLVIWDLDETFWKGTLTEGEIELPSENIELVKYLAGRGIISSIASKNDFEKVERILSDAGVWDYFVFPSISFDPKGQRIADIISNAGLRPDNVLFIDDNLNNLEEAKYFSKGLMTALPYNIFAYLKNHAEAKGKPDTDLTRLKQYRLLQRKFDDKDSYAGSNEEFLRESNIRIHFRFDVEEYFERIVELINRSNQLNYTKKRVLNELDHAELKASLNKLDHSCACVFCRDNYGDYGMIGFYLMKKRAAERKLIHFLFSCRTMNMGIEEFVYRFLGRPEIAIVPDVSYLPDGDRKIDWIAIEETAEQKESLVSSQNRLLLIGGCELLQLSGFCSNNRSEFVNGRKIRPMTGTGSRYDDPYFLLCPRDVLKRDEALVQLTGWTPEDADLVDQELRSAAIIILGMRAALRHHYLISRTGVPFRLTGTDVGYLLTTKPEWMRQFFRPLNLDAKDRLLMIEAVFKHVANICSGDAMVFIVGANTRRVSDTKSHGDSVAYNQICGEFAKKNPGNFVFVDVDKVVPEEYILDGDHFSRAGYSKISKFIANTGHLR